MKYQIHISIPDKPLLIAEGDRTCMAIAANWASIHKYAYKLFYSSTNFREISMHNSKEFILEILNRHI